MLLAPFNNVQMPLREEPQITTTKLIVQIAQDGNTQTLTKFKLHDFFFGKLSCIIENIVDKTKHINTQGTPTQMLQTAPDTFICVSSKSSMQLLI